MARNLTTINAKNIRAVGNRVLVTDMYFGEQKTAGGLIITNDDGKTRGIYPRWGRVYAKGPSNKDEYNVGDWILVEHGRWTRKFPVEIDGETIELQKVEVKSIIGWQEEEPDTAYWGEEYRDGAGYDIDPSVFLDRM